MYGNLRSATFPPYPQPQQGAYYGGGREEETTVVKNLALNKRTCGPDLPWYCLNCMNLGKLILRKIIKIVATRCHFLKLKYTKFDFGAGGAYNANPDPLAGFKGAYF